MTDWEARYAENDMPWDKGEAAPPLAEYLEHNNISGHVLVPGCGRGHDVRLLAQQGAETTGLDLSPSAIRKATYYDNPSTAHFEVGDLFALPSKWNSHFDFVFEHTCFCAIDPSMRPDYVQAVHQALKPGGHLLAIFYVIIDDPDPNHPPYPVSIEAIDSFFHSHFETQRAWTPQKAYPSRQGGKEQMRLLRKK